MGTQRLSRWSKAVLSQLQALNDDFPQPLPYAEVKATAKSISNWTWQRMTPAGLQDLIERTHTPEKQAERGKRATNQADAGKASGQARRLGKEQDRATARILRAQGMKQAEIAAYLGVTQQAISKWLQ